MSSQASPVAIQSRFTAAHDNDASRQAFDLVLNRAWNYDATLFALVVAGDDTLDQKGPRAVRLVMADPVRNSADITMTLVLRLAHDANTTFTMVFSPDHVQVTANTPSSKMVHGINAITPQGEAYIETVLRQWLGDAMGDARAQVIWNNRCTRFSPAPRP